jgi:hypothetical protein
VKVFLFELFPTIPSPQQGQDKGEGEPLRALGLDERDIGNNPQNWHTNIPTYAKVQYQDIYPGIDLIYYGNQRQLSKRARDWLPVPYPQ